MLKWMLILLSTVCAFSFVEPQYSGVFDVRYIKSNAASGAGLFSISDFELFANFPIDPHRRLVYETHLASNNIEWAQQFYFDIDPISLPGSFRLGRFNLPFGQEPGRLKDRAFMANRVIYDIPSLIPKSETGVGYFHNTRPFSVDLFFVNANDGTAKTTGGDLRFLIKDTLDAGFSMMWADSLFLAGTDYHFPLGPFDFSADYQLVSGRSSGVPIEGNGASGQVLINIDKSMAIGSQYSVYNKNDSPKSSRLLFNTTLRLSYDLTIRLEYMIDHLLGVDDNVFQAQWMVAL